MTNRESCCIISRPRYVLWSRIVLISGLIFAPGKTLTQPLLIFLVIAIAAVGWALRRARDSRRPLAVGLAALLILWMFSTNAVGSALQRSLEVAVPNREIEPDVIVVLSGGWNRGADRGTDVLTSTTEARLSAGVEWWKEHPRARLILSGMDEYSGEPRRMVELMRDEAIRRGVPGAAITLETRSRNTREHPLRLRELPGITSATRIGVVTTSDHMRRALYSFRRHFPTVITHPASSPRTRMFLVNCALPSVDGLDRSTDAIHEWIGLAWYALLDAFSGQPPARDSSRGVQR